MKLERATLTRFRLPLRVPLQTAHGLVEQRDGLLLEIHGAGAACGLGEVMPIAGFPGESLPRAERALASALAAVVGRSESPAELVGRAVSSFAGTPLAATAFSGALADLDARERRMPLATWLSSAFAPTSEAGAARPASIAVNALVNGAAPREVADSAARGLAAGYRCFKLKVGALPLAEDIARVAALRRALGRGPAIRVDANEAWSEEAAAAALEALAPFDLEYVEQPVPAAELAALGRLQRASGVALAADEAASSARDIERVIAARACDVLVLKPALLGGPSAAFALARRARDAGMRCVVTSFIDSAVGVAHALAVAAALGDEGSAHGLGTGALLACDLATLEVVQGRLVCPSGVGLGFDVDRAALAAIARGTPREFAS